MTGANDADKVMLILAYLGPLALVPYLATDQKDDIKWHAKQGLTLTGVWIVIYLLAGFFGTIPVFGWLLLMPMPFIGLAILAIVIVAIVNALKGERWRIPLVADLTEKW